MQKNQFFLQSFIKFGKCTSRYLLTFAILHLLITNVNAQYLSHQDMANLPPLSADVKISYGVDSLQFGELRLPDGNGPYPIAVVIHGGCWMTIANLHIMDHFCVELTRAGIATWNLEYRRIGDPGGGWPGTFIDIGDGIDHVVNMAEKYNLDLSRVVFIGHSSGGHLALWAGARHCLPDSNILYSKNPLKPTGVVSLAGLANLRDMVERTKAVCGSDVIKSLLGGTFEEFPNRYRMASPITSLPTGIDQILIYGADDPAVPAELGQSYAEMGKSLKENIGFCVIPKASHFELIAPWSSSWPIVEGTIKSLIFVQKEKNITKPK